MQKEKKKETNKIINEKKPQEILSAKGIEIF